MDQHFIFICYHALQQHQHRLSIEIDRFWKFVSRTKLIIIRDVMCDIKMIIDIISLLFPPRRKSSSALLLISSHCLLPYYRNMRRAVSSTGGAREDSSPPSSNKHNDLDEKTQKLQKRNESRLVRVFLFLGMLCFIFLVAIVKLHHTPDHKKYRSASVRRRHQDQQQQQDHDASLLPLNSIYRLEVENNTGKQESLAQYAGMVSLVVNVASE